MGLCAAFLSAWKGADPGPGFEHDLADAARRARAVWPDVAIGDDDFARYLAARAPADLDPDAALARLHVEDLYLACGCIRGDAAALRGFDERLLARLPLYLARMRADQRLIEETQQALRARLFVGADGAPPRIGLYSGLGPLDGWLRVAAVRAALNLVHFEKRHVAGDLPADDVLPAGGDLELDYLREHCRAAFAEALRRAVAELPAGDRALLRFQFVDGLSPGDIAPIFGVHRTTILRRIAAARKALLEATRAHVMRELRLSASECDSLIGLIRSNLNITLGSLFRSKP